MGLFCPEVNLITGHPEPSSALGSMCLGKAMSKLEHAQSTLISWVRGDQGPDSDWTPLLSGETGRMRPDCRLGN